MRVRRWGAPARAGAEAGNILVLTAGMMLVLLLMVALAVDIGLATLGRRQLQNASDAAALAAALELDGTTAGLDRATSRAQAVASLHSVLSEPVALGSGGGDGTPDVQLGHFDLTDRSFTVTGSAPEVNSVRVQARRFATRGQGIATTFGALAGIDTMDVGSDAIAVGAGVGQVECAAPVTVPRCSLDLNPNFCVDPTPLTFNPSTTNTAGFAVFSGTANTPNIAAQIGACDGYLAGTTVCLGNGANLASPQIHQKFVDKIVAGVLWDDPDRPLPARNSKSAVPAASYGKVWHTWIPIIDGGDDFCSPPDSFNQCGWPVVGFAPFALYDVVVKGSTKTIYGYIDCRLEDIDLGMGGGSYTGIDSRPRLVR